MVARGTFGGRRSDAIARSVARPCGRVAMPRPVPFHKPQSRSVSRGTRLGIGSVAWRGRAVTRHLVRLRPVSRGTRPEIGPAALPRAVSLAITGRRPPRGRLVKVRTRPVSRGKRSEVSPEAPGAPCDAIPPPSVLASWSGSVLSPFTWNAARIQLGDAGTRPGAAPSHREPPRSLAGRPPHGRTPRVAESDAD